MGWQDAPETASNKPAWMNAPEHGAAAPPSGPQPSMLDTAIASPTGRFIQGNVIQPLASGAHAAMEAVSPFTGGLSSMLGVMGNVLSAKEQQGYQGAIQRNQNTPGYTAQRAIADKLMADRGGSGLADQLTAPFNPTIAGMAGQMAGGRDASNAMADAQTQAQDAYHKQHPWLSAGAGIAGGLLMAPERGALPDLSAAPNPGLRNGALEAHQAGYVLPPSMASETPGGLANGLAGWSGKIKTAQAASEANQEVTNALAAKSLGIDPEQGITEAALRNVRAEAGKAYTAIPKALPVVTQDADFVDAIGQINDKTASLSQAFPNITKNSEIEDLVGDLTNAQQFKTEDGISLVRQLRKDATANFRAAADPKKLALAQAQRDAADAVDDLIERNLAQTGQDGLVADYRAARQTIAKSYDLQSATNLVSGNVNAQRLATLMGRGRPLTGELQTIAKAASAFPKAMQPLDRIGGVEPLSTLDLAGAAVTAAHGNYGVAAGLLGKPLARAAVLGPRMQESIMTRAVGAPVPPLSLPSLTPESRIPLGTLPQLLLQTQRRPQNG